MSDDEAALTSTLAGLQEELRASLERMEALHKQWDNPMAKNSLIRRALRAELRAAGLKDSNALTPPELAQGLERTPPSPDVIKTPSRDVIKTPTMTSFGSIDLKYLMWRRTKRFDEDTPAPDPEFTSQAIGVRLALWRLTHRHGTLFESAVALAIFASSVVVGVEIQCDLEGSTDCSNTARSLEHAFLALFILELLIRFMSDGKGVWECRWFLYDFILVVLGVVSFWVVQPILRHTTDNGSKLQLKVFDQVLLLRILRLTRLARAVRIFEYFPEMWKLANGLMRSFRTVISACVVIMLTVYLLACLGIELIGRNPSLLEDPDIAGVIQENFSSLQVAMLTLIQFTSADDIADVYRPIVEKAWYWGIYFGFVWLLLTIILMNLITAVIVDSAISQGDADREMELDMKRRRCRALQTDVENVFRDLDKSETGKLSLKGFRSGMQKMQQAGMEDLPKDLRKLLDSDQIVEVCDYFDVDRSGEIDMRQFVDGVFSLMLQSVPIETTQMLQLLRSQTDMLQTIKGNIKPSMSPKSRPIRPSTLPESRESDDIGAGASA